MARDMANTGDIAGQLAARFDTPLDALQRRRVVIWHDADGSFEDEFDRLAGS